MSAHSSCSNMHEVKSSGLLLIQVQCLVLLYSSQKAGFLVTRLFMIINENLFLDVTFSEKWSEKGRQRSTSLNCQVEIVRYEWVHLIQSHTSVLLYYVSKYLQFSTINLEKYHKEKDLEICALKLNIQTKNFIIICI